MPIKKILLPISIPDIEHGVVHQAAFLARRFGAEIILLHVVTPFSYPAGLLESGHEMTARDLQAEVVKQTQKHLDEALKPELEGIAVRRLLLRGEPAREIIQVSRDAKVDLIVMATQGLGGVYRLLLGSVTAKVLHDVDCAVWTSALGENSKAGDFRVRKILCAVDLAEHSLRTVKRAAELASELGAQLALVHVTPGVETFGPGGTYVVPEWKERLVGYATQEIAKLQQAAGTHAEVIIESGHLHKSLNDIASKAGGDLLVIGHLAHGSHLGANGSGYPIIRESQIPVLSL